MTIRELIEMLSQVDRDLEVVIAPSPDASGWVYSPLGMMGKGSKPEIIVIGPRAEPRYNDEIDIVWAYRPI